MTWKLKEDKLFIVTLKASNKYDIINMTCIFSAESFPSNLSPKAWVFYKHISKEMSPGGMWSFHFEQAALIRCHPTDLLFSTFILSTMLSQQTLH